jgi:hypothetical protein
MMTVPHASAVMLGFVDGVLVERCSFVNVGEHGWALHIGMLNPPNNSYLTAVVNRNVLVRDTLFDGLEGTLEQLLITNTRDARIERCIFRHAASGNSVGLYQWNDNVVVTECTFEDVKVGLYYSRSCNNTVVEDSMFRGCGNGIKGALQSDNDCTDIVGNRPNELTFPFRVEHPEYATVFGVARAHHLHIRNSTFTGCKLGAPIEIGAVDDAVVDSCTFAENDNLAIAISRGGMPVDVPNAGVVISRCHFASTNNRERRHHLIHPAILVMGPQPAIGLVVTGCTFGFSADEQLFGITFAGGLAYGDVCITNNSFEFAPKGADGAAVGARAVVFEGGGTVADSDLVALVSPNFLVCNNSADRVKLGPYYDQSLGTEAMPACNADALARCLVLRDGHSRTCTAADVERCGLRGPPRRGRRELVTSTFAP